MATYYAGAAQLTIDPDGTPLIIDKDEQLEGIVVSLEKDVFELRAQSSSRPEDYIQTGVGLTVDVSIADSSQLIDLIALAYGGTVVVNGGKRKIDVSDNAGLGIGGKKLLIKPYNGETPSTNANTWITIYNAKLIDLSGTELAYNISTQQQIRFRFMACRPAAGTVKFTIGDTTA